MKASIPPNEHLRLEALRKYEILDTADELAYDDLVSLAATICGTPAAGISLVDECRQWFKARRGLDFREADRDLSFCAHAILKPDQVLVVPDASTDPRFADNDLVWGRAQIRFYAGAPLINPEGLPLGTLCVIDHHARPITTAQVEALRSLSRQVVSQLELRRTLVMLRDQADALMKSKEDALAATKAKAAFLANISHEIRTPMNGVVGVASLLASTPLSERQRHYVETIEKSAESLLGVLSNVVEFSKNAAGNPDLVLAPIDIPKFVEDVAELMLPVAIAKGVRLLASIDDAFHRPLMADRLRLQQILTNLVGNALKFTPQGSVELIVTKVDESSQGQTVRFQVSDTGIGIAADRHRAIFEEFVQVDVGTERQFSGAGLGLSICKQLAHLMGSKIEVKSEVGVGSTFWLDVPFAFESNAHAEPTRGSETLGSSDVPIHVLIAEDNEVNSLVLTAMLEHNGCTVRCVMNGQDAISVLGTERFDLVFMDVQMPIMDGIEATKAIRRSSFPSASVPIIALTASILQEDASLCRLAGMNDFISKPINEKVISAALERWIVRARTTVT